MLFAAVALPPTTAGWSGWNRAKNGFAGEGEGSVGGVVPGVEARLRKGLLEARLTLKGRSAREAISVVSCQYGSDAVMPSGSYAKALHGSATPLLRTLP